MVQGKDTLEMDIIESYLWLYAKSQVGGRYSWLEPWDITKSRPLNSAIRCSSIVHHRKKIHRNQILDSHRQFEPSVVVVGLAGAVFVDLGQAIAGIQLFLLRLAGRIKDWTLSVARNANRMTPMRSESVGSGVVLLRVSFKRYHAAKNRLTQMRLSQNATSFFCH